MYVIAHQAIRQDTQMIARGVLTKQFQVDALQRIGEKYIAPIVAALRNVVR